MSGGGSRDTLRAAGRINERFGQEGCPIKMLRSSQKCCMDFGNRLDIKRWMDRERVCERVKENKRECVFICLAPSAASSESWQAANDVRYS